MRESRFWKGLLILITILLFCFRVGKNRTTTAPSFREEIDRTLLDLIDNHTVISFDIFDTLLVRPYVKPTDLFLHLEMLEKVDGFSAARVEAEQQARKLHSNSEDITLDEIYEIMPSHLQFMKTKEEEFELQVLFPNPDIIPLFNYAKIRRKRIIVISDMYLPKQFIWKALVKNGFEDVKAIYVSSDYRMTKSNGNLFKKVLSKEKIQPTHLLHFGDNLYSDILPAQQLKIHTVFCKKRIEKLFEMEYRFKLFYESHSNNINCSLLLGLLSLNDFNDYWTTIGYRYGGPCIVGYMKWLDNVLSSDHTDLVLFIGRDGYLLEKIFNMIKTRTVNTAYFYAPRIINIILNCDYRYLHGHGAEVLVRYIKKKDEFFQRHAPDNPDPEEAVRFLEKHKGKLDKIIQKETLEYKKYLRTFSFRNSEIGIVDTVSSALSAQRMLMKLLPENEIHGYYWYLWNPTNRTKYLCSTFQESYGNLFINWDFMELLMTAPTPPIETIQDNKPVFKKLSHEEQTRITLHINISQGVLAFAKTYKRILCGNAFFFSAEFLADWINLFYQTPTSKDLINCAHVQHSADADHMHYRSLMPAWY